MKAHPPSASRPVHRAVRGFSLIELMVAIAIALIVSLAIFSVLTASEARKRSTTGVNDINQSGAYSAYVLDRAIRSAGAGFANQYVTLLRRADLEGCALSVMRDNAVIAPRATAYPAPFDGITQTPVLAPVIIDPGTGGASDVLTVMSGSQGRSETGLRVIGPSVTGVGVVNTFGFSAGDLVVFGRDVSEGSPCVVSQVASSFTPQVPPTTDAVSQSLPLAAAGTGTYGNSAGTAALAGSLALGIGNATNNAPQFKMFGVDANRNLVAYDLLNIDGTGVPQPVADNVLSMFAIYGVDTTDDNQIDAWVQPTGVWSPTTLRNGTAASAANLRRIVAVHVALILRTALEERDNVQANTAFTLYSGLLPTPGFTAPTVTFSGGSTQRFRYRLIETTIPVRNNLL